MTIYYDSDSLINLQPNLLIESKLSASKESQKNRWKELQRSGIFIEKDPELRPELQRSGIFCLSIKHATLRKKLYLQGQKKTL